MGWELNFKRYQNADPSCGRGMMQNVKKELFVEADDSLTDGVILSA